MLSGKKIENNRIAIVGIIRFFLRPEAFGPIFKQIEAW